LLYPDQNTPTLREKMGTILLQPTSLVRGLLDSSQSSAGRNWCLEEWLPQRTTSGPPLLSGNSMPHRSPKLRYLNVLLLGRPCPPRSPSSKGWVASWGPSDQGHAVPTRQQEQQRGSACLPDAPSAWGVPFIKGHLPSRFLGRAATPRSPGDSVAAYN